MVMPVPPPPLLRNTRPNCDESEELVRVIGPEALRSVQRSDPAFWTLTLWLSVRVMLPSGLFCTPFGATVAVA